MYWKMSIDLSYPLVLSMGHHDPLDGFITYNQLQSTAATDSVKSTGPDLIAEIADMASICEGKRWATDDPLGIGGLLCDAFRVAQLVVSENFARMDLLEILLEDSLLGLKSYGANTSLKLPADHRLAFRELGLSIGLRAIEKLQKLIEENPNSFKRQRALRSQIEALKRYEPLIAIIETFWLESNHRESNTWSEHRDINMVMLATSLAPDGYLSL